jgi:RHS repeat-associated protein
VVDAGVTKNYTPDNINRYTTADSTTPNSNNVGQGPEHQIGGFQNNNYSYVGDSYVAAISGGGNNYTVGYDALGRCVKRTFSGNTNSTTYYIYDGEKAIAEYNPAGSQIDSNVYGRGIDEILMRFDASLGYNIFYQHDHEGSVTHLTDWSRNVLETFRYDAFGAVTIRNGTGQVISQTAYNNRLMFTGREYIQQFGIYEYRARTYHPGLGRFMSEDPKGFDAGDYNVFRYCGNDPLDHTDPMGLDFNGDLDAKEVEIIPGKFGQTGVRVDMVPKELKDGSYTLRLDLTVRMREVARTAKWHGRIVIRKEEEKRETAEVHEKQEHNKDWKGFHDEHQKDVSSTRFKSPEAAKAAAEAAQKRLENEARKAAQKFDQHEDRKRWDPIERLERPH